MASAASTPHRTGHSVFHALFPIAAFWLFTVGVFMADRGDALERIAMIAVGVIGLFLLSARVPITKVLLVTLGVVVALLSMLRFAQVLEAVQEGRVPDIDIATTTIDSVELQQQGENPYTTLIDPIGHQVDPTGTGLRFFGGFKYGPAMTWVYTPGVLARGAGGFYITNFALLMLTAGAAAWWASRRGRAAALGAAALTLAPGLWHHDLFSKGSNDIAPVALAMLAFAFRAHGLAIPAAIALGLSFGTKPLPALLFALPLILMADRRWRVTLVAGVTTFLCYLPALIRSPQELIAALVMFNAARPPDNTSLLEGAPQPLVLVAVAVSLVAGLALPALWDALQSRWSPRWAALVASAALAVSFIGSRQVHRNYLVWLVPVLAVGLAATVWGTEEDDQGVPTGSLSPSTKNSR